MRRGIVYSVLFHAVVLTVGYYGMPALRRLPPAMDAAIVVELVTVAELTNAPPPEAKPEPKPEPEPEPKPAKAEPPPEPAKAEPPPPPPEPEVAAVPPPPEEQPKAKPELKPKPKPKPKAKPNPKAPPRLAKVKPRRKPRPPDVFASVLKTVEDLKPRPPKPKEKTEKKKKKKKAEESFEAQVAKALQSQARRHDTDGPITISEIDLVRRQIAQCWNLQAGAKEAENLIIEIYVSMNPDGTVRHARIQNSDRVAGDPFFRAAAESALRAVLNPRCQPFKLPRDRYARWQTMALIFDPKEMF